MTISALVTRPVAAPVAVKPLQHTRPIAKPVPARALPTDSLKLTSRFDDAQALALLQQIASQYGSLKKPGFFSNPGISPEDALARLKKGDDIIIESKQIKGVSDRLKRLSDLQLLDELSIKRTSHGVSKPEWRLPLLFMDGHKMTATGGENEQRLDAYNAYRELDDKWPIEIDGKEVKGKDLAAYVIQKGFTQKADPQLALWQQFSRLPAAGWQVQGQTASREVAYLAYLTGNPPLQFQGAAVKDSKDMALLLNLALNEANDAIPADLRSRLVSLKLTDFQSPVGHLYSVYQHLAAGQALTYQGQKLSNLDDVIVFDALQGSQRPTDLLPTTQHQALLYLAKDQGLTPDSAYGAYQAAKQGDIVRYTFAGGPTGEGFLWSARSVSELVDLQQRVVVQRLRDQYRPEWSEAQRILQERLQGFQQPLKDNLQRSLTAAERAKADIPVQQQKLAQARQDYDRIKPLHDKAQNDYQTAEQKYRQADREFSSAKREYDWVYTQRENLRRDYQWAERDYYSAQSHARSAEDQARREDQLATSDPQNAATHRANAERFRNDARRYHSEADRHRQRMQQVQFDLQRVQWDFDRADRNLDNARQNLRYAESDKNTKLQDWNYQKNQLNDASSRQQQAQGQINLAEQTLAETDQIVSHTQSAQSAVDSTLSSLKSLGNYGDYQAVRDAIQLQQANLQQAVSSPVYLKIHGPALQKALLPVGTLLQNMDKPAVSKTI